MPSFTTRLHDGWEQSLEHLSFALVPLFTALLNTEKVTSVLSPEGFHFGMKRGLSISVFDLWTFVDPPNQEANVSFGVPMVGFSEALLAIPVGVIIQAALSAGYFGSIEDGLTTHSSTIVVRFNLSEDVRVRSSVEYSLISFRRRQPLPIMT